MNLTPLYVYSTILISIVNIPRSLSSYWEPWGEWSLCFKWRRERSRSCRRLQDQNCQGPGEESEECDMNQPPIDPNQHRILGPSSEVRIHAEDSFTATPVAARVFQNRHDPRSQTKGGEMTELRISVPAEDERSFRHLVQIINSIKVVIKNNSETEEWHFPDSAVSSLARSQQNPHENLWSGSLDQWPGHRGQMPRESSRTRSSSETLIDGINQREKAGTVKMLHGLMETMHLDTTQSWSIPAEKLKLAKTVHLDSMTQPERLAMSKNAQKVLTALSTKDSWELPLKVVMGPSYVEHLKTNEPSPHAAVSEAIIAANNLLKTIEKKPARKPWKVEVIPSKGPSPISTIAPIFSGLPRRETTQLPRSTIPNFWAEWDQRHNNKRVVVAEQARGSLNRLRQNEGEAKRPGSIRGHPVFAPADSRRRETPSPSLKEQNRLNILDRETNGIRGRPIFSNNQVPSQSQGPERRLEADSSDPTISGRPIFSREEEQRRPSSSRSSQSASEFKRTHVSQTENRRSGHESGGVENSQSRGSISGRAIFPDDGPSPTTDQKSTSIQGRPIFGEDADSNGHPSNKASEADRILSEGSSDQVLIRTQLSSGMGGRPIMAGTRNENFHQSNTNDNHRRPNTASNRRFKQTRDRENTEPKIEGRPMFTRSENPSSAQRSQPSSRSEISGHAIFPENTFNNQINTGQNTRESSNRRNTNQSNTNDNHRRPNTASRRRFKQTRDRENTEPKIEGRPMFTRSENPSSAHRSQPSSRSEISGHAIFPENTFNNQINTGQNTRESSNRRNTNQSNTNDNHRRPNTASRRRFKQTRDRENTEPKIEGRPMFTRSENPSSAHRSQPSSRSEISGHAIFPENTFNNQINIGQNTRESSNRRNTNQEPLISSSREPNDIIQSRTRNIGGRPIFPSEQKRSNSHQGQETKQASKSSIGGNPMFGEHQKTERRPENQRASNHEFSPEGSRQRSIFPTRSGSGGRSIGGRAIFPKDRETKLTSTNFQTEEKPETDKPTREQRIRGRPILSNDLESKPISGDFQSEKNEPVKPPSKIEGRPIFPSTLSERLEQNAIRRFGTSGNAQTSLRAMVNSSPEQTESTSSKRDRRKELETSDENERIVKFSSQETDLRMGKILDLLSELQDRSNSRINSQTAIRSASPPNEYSSPGYGSPGKAYPSPPAMSPPSSLPPGSRNGGPEYNSDTYSRPTSSPVRSPGLIESAGNGGGWQGIQSPGKSVDQQFISSPAPLRRPEPMPPGPASSGPAPIDSNPRNGFRSPSPMTSGSGSAQQAANGFFSPSPIGSRSHLSRGRVNQKSSSYVPSHLGPRSNQGSYDAPAAAAPIIRGYSNLGSPSAREPGYQRPASSINIMNPSPAKAPSHPSYTATEPKIVAEILPLAPSHSVPSWERSLYGVSKPQNYIEAEPINSPSIASRINSPSPLSTAPSVNQKPVEKEFTVLRNGQRFLIRVPESPTLTPPPLLGSENRMPNSNLYSPSTRVGIRSPGSYLARPSPLTGFYGPPAPVPLNQGIRRGFHSPAPRRRPGVPYGNVQSPAVFISGPTGYPAIGLRSVSVRDPRSKHTPSNDAETSGDDTTKALSFPSGYSSRNHGANETNSNRKQTTAASDDSDSFSVRPVLQMHSTALKSSPLVPPQRLNTNATRREIPISDLTSIPAWSDSNSAPSLTHSSPPSFSAEPPSRKHESSEEWIRRRPIVSSVVASYQPLSPPSPTKSPAPAWYDSNSTTSKPKTTETPNERSENNIPTTGASKKSNSWERYQRGPLNVPYQPSIDSRLAPSQQPKAPGIAVPSIFSPSPLSNSATIPPTVISRDYSATAIDNATSLLDDLNTPLSPPSYSPQAPGINSLATPTQPKSEGEPQKPSNGEESWHHRRPMSMAAPRISRINTVSTSAPLPIFVYDTPETTTERVIETTTKPVVSQNTPYPPEYGERFTADNFAARGPLQKAAARQPSPQISPPGRGMSSGGQTWNSYPYEDRRNDDPSPVYSYNNDGPYEYSPPNAEEVKQVGAPPALPSSSFLERPSKTTRPPPDAPGVQPPILDEFGEWADDYFSEDPLPAQPTSRPTWFSATDVERRSRRSVSRRQRLRRQVNQSKRFSNFLIISVIRFLPLF